MTIKGLARHVMTDTSGGTGRSPAVEPAANLVEALTPGFGAAVPGARLNAS
jgi:hypothetical protein